MAFDKVPRLLADWTSSQELLAQKPELVEGKGNTAMCDTCFAAMEKLQSAQYSKHALILISDGQDNGSHHTFEELRQLLRSADVTLYGISVPNPRDMGSSLDLERARAGQNILRELAKITGGVAFFPQGKHLKQAIELIAAELRQQYRIGFRPDKTDPPNKWHGLKVRVKPLQNSPIEFSKLMIRTRQGYYTQ